MAVLGATNLTGCNSIPDFIAGGSLVTFQQTSAPTSWTKQTTHNNKALRVVSGTASSGGSTAFTSVFTSRTPTGSVSGSNSGGSVSNHTLSTAQLASHSHTYTTFTEGGAYAGGPFQARDPLSTLTSGGTGSSNAHNHGFSNPSWSGSFSGSALDFAVQYVDLIICSKN